MKTEGGSGGDREKMRETEADQDEDEDEERRLSAWNSALERLVSEEQQLRGAAAASRGSGLW